MYCVHSFILLAYLAGGTFALFMITSLVVAKIIPISNTDIMITSIELATINVTSVRVLSLVLLCPVV